MPCYTISTVEIDLGKMDPGLAKLALEAMGLRPTHNQDAKIITHWEGAYDYGTGTSTWRLSNSQERTTEFKKAYSAEILKSQAKRYGWTLKQDATDRFAYTITKR